MGNFFRIRSTSVATVMLLAALASGDAPAKDDTTSLMQPVSIGTATAIIHGDKEGFHFVGPANQGCVNPMGKPMPPRRCRWGSGWNAGMGYVSVGLWGVKGDVEGASPADAHLHIRVSIWTDGDPPNLVVERLSHRCHPMDNTIRFVSADNTRPLLLAADGDCGGIELTRVEFDEPNSTYLLEGRFDGAWRQSGKPVKGQFHARVPRAPW